MPKPDFAFTDLGRLGNPDLKFLIENMPQAGTSYREIADIIRQLPTTVESMLTSDYVYQAILDRRRLLLDISPFLLFSVLLRRSLNQYRSPLDRQVINYIANLLTLFIRTDRIYRVQSRDTVTYEYLVDLIQDAQEADPRRQFMTYAHIGNYALYLTGLFPHWIEHRYRYHKRLVNTQDYEDFGRSYFDLAGKHPLAREFGLGDVFLRLALMFDDYRRGLNYMVSQWMPLA